MGELVAPPTLEAVGHFRPLHAFDCHFAVWSLMDRIEEVGATRQTDQNHGIVTAIFALC